MTPDEIAVLFRAGESDRVERKRLAKPDLKDIRRAICAFANDLSGSGLPGLVIVGQNDDGSCANIGIDDEFLRLLASSRGEVQPFPSIDVRRVVVDNCEIAVVVVQPSSSPPLRYDGRVWVRVGPTTQLASPADELRLLERRRMANVPFDGQPVDSATTGDLDLGLFSSQYLPSVVASDVLAANGRSQGQQLAALHLTTPDGVPTAAGLLVIGKDPMAHLPGAYIQFIRFEGERLTAPILDEKRLSGPLAEMLSALDDLIRLNIRVAVDVTSGPRETRRPDYPVVALQQLLRNAVMHRSYQGTNAPVKFHWFSDRVEILSPGGPYGMVTQANFGDPGLADYRNPHLAEAMKALGFVQRFGIGIALARQSLDENGNPPLLFETTPNHVLAVLEAVR